MHSYNMTIFLSIELWQYYVYYNNVSVCGIRIMSVLCALHNNMSLCGHNLIAELGALQ